MDTILLQYDVPNSTATVVLNTNATQYKSTFSLTTCSSAIQHEPLDIGMLALRKCDTLATEFDSNMQLRRCTASKKAFCRGTKKCKCLKREFLMCLADSELCDYSLPDEFFVSLGECLNQVQVYSYITGITYHRSVSDFLQYKKLVDKLSRLPKPDNNVSSRVVLEEKQAIISFVEAVEEIHFDDLEPTPDYESFECVACATECTIPLELEPVLEIEQPLVYMPTTDYAFLTTMVQQYQCETSPLGEEKLLSVQQKCEDTLHLPNKLARNVPISRMEQILCTREKLDLTWFKRRFRFGKVKVKYKLKLLQKPRVFKQKTEVIRPSVKVEDYD